MILVHGLVKASSKNSGSNNTNNNLVENLNGAICNNNGSNTALGSNNVVPLFNPSSIFNTHEEYVIITKPDEVKEISTAILRSRPEPILGVDCEGLAKGRPLCLL